MKTNLLKGCLASVFLATSTLASAGMIDGTQSDTIAEQGVRNAEQDHFIWKFEGLTADIQEINLTFDWVGMDFNDKADDDNDFKFYEQFEIFSGDVSLGIVGAFEDNVKLDDSGNTVNGCTSIVAGTNIYGETWEGWDSDCSGTKSITLTDSSLWASDVLTLTAVSNFFYRTDGFYTEEWVASSSVLKYGVQSNGDFTSLGDDNLPGYITATIDYKINDSAQEVPEPSSIAIMALGLMGLASRRLKNRT